MLKIERHNFIQTKEKTWFADVSQVDGGMMMKKYTNWLSILTILILFVAMTACSADAPPGGASAQPLSIASPRFVYATSWNGNKLTLCTVMSDGTFTSCSSIPAPNASSVNQLSTYPGGIAINPAGTIAYISDYTNGVLMCNIDSTTGLLSNCTSTGSGYTNATIISLNAAGTYAYIGDYSAGIPIIKCSVTPVTGALSSCTTTTATFSYPTSVVFNSAGTTAYVGNYDVTQISVCSVDLTTGDLSSCTSTPNTPTGMLYTTGVALNSDETILYVTSNNNNSVNQCPIKSDGTLLSCTSTGTAAGGSGWPGLKGPFGVTLNAAKTFAYIANYDSSNVVTMCSVNPSDGSLINCSNTGSGFTSPLGLTFLY